MTRLLQFSALLFLLTACSSGYQYYLETMDAAGVEEGATVYRQGVEIGEVTSVEFAGKKVRLGIETEDPLFEGQDFDLGRGPNGEPAVELESPDRNADELANGATLEETSFNLDLDDDMSDVVKDIFNGNGDKLEAKMEEIFGKEGEKLEAKMEEIFGKDGEKVEAAVENIIGKDGEKIKASIENLIGKDGEKLQESIESIIGEDGEKLKGLAENFGKEFEELGKRIEEVNEQYEKDSPAWKKEMKKVLEEWAESGN